MTRIIRAFASLVLGCSIVLSAACMRAGPASVLAAANASAQSVPISIPSGDAVLRGTMFIAEGGGPHPTVLLLHGFPGGPRLASVGEGLQRSGFNVLFVHYRGTWSSTGLFSLENALEDVDAALDFLHAPAAAAHRVDPSQIALVGHSMGSWMALTTAARRSDIACVAGFGLANVGRLGARWAAEPAYRAGWTASIAKASAGEGAPVRPAQSADEMVAWVVDHSAVLDLARLGTALRDRSVLLVGAEADETTPFDEHHARTRDAYRAAGVTRLRDGVLPGPHDFVAVEPDLVARVSAWLREDCQS
jgi:pimeloyl-ACP methyl ester carboxylesterase